MDVSQQILIFNSVFLVLWTVNPLPWLIDKKEYLAIATVFAVIFPIELYLYSEVRDYPWNYIVSINMCLLSLVGGLLMHKYSGNYNQKDQ